MPAPVTAGGPGWWAGNSIIEQAALASGPVIRKTPRAHAAHISPAATGAAALKIALGEAGLGPRVLAHDRASGAVTMSAPGPDFELGTYSRILKSGALGAIVQAHRAVGELTGGPNDESLTALPAVPVVAEMRRLSAAAALVGAMRPADSAHLDSSVARLTGMLGGSEPTVPSLGDATAGNVLLGSSGQVLLLGGTLAARLEPAHVAGCLLAEFGHFVAEPREVFELYWGAFDPEAYERARLFAILEDLRWGYISRIATALNSDDEFVASLYGLWRVRRGMFDLSDATATMKRGIA
jgi:hypothetical protein